MYCPTCGTYNDDNARYCSKCGTPLSAPRHAAHLDTDGDGVPDALEAQTVLMPGQERTTVMGAEPTTVMAAPETPLDQTRVAPAAYAQQQSRRYAPAPAPAPEPAPKKSYKGVIAAILALVVLACAGFGVKYYLDYRAEQAAAEQARIEQEEAKRKAEEEARLLEEKRQPHDVVLPLSAEGLDSSGTRVPVRITGADFEGNPIDTTGYLEANGSGLTLPKGSYEVIVLASPIAGDGTLYRVPDGTFAFEIPETQETGSTFNAPGTLVLVPYAAGEASSDVLENAVAYALADPAMNDDVIYALADKANTASSEATHEQAVREAEEKGRTVVTGTVRVVNGRELCEMQNLDIDQVFGDFAAAEEQNTYVIILFDHEMSLDCQSGDGSGIRTDTATMISLTRQDTTWWEEREGQRVTIAFSPDETWWPSDVSLPAGEPRTAFVQVID